MTSLISKRSSAAGTKVGELPDEPKPDDPEPDDPEPDDPKPLEPQPTLTSAPYTGTSTSTSTSTITVSLSSATASSAPLIPYVVVTEELTREAGTALQDRMKPYVMGPIDANLREDEQGTQTMVFRFNTMATLAKELELLHDTDIAWIFPESDVGYDEDEPSTPGRATSPPLGPGPELASQGVFYDPGADASLKALSQPADYASYDPNDMYGYAYPTSSGKGITIYIIDTGANPTHEEYAGSPGLKRWMYVAKNTFQSDSDTKRGHGSCVQSLVNGPRFGAAKGADIVIVKLPDPFTTSDIITALYWVTDDIAKRSLEGKAVVTMSVYTVGVDIAKSKAFGIQVLKDGWDATAESMRDQMELLIYLDVPVVVASENDRQEYEHIDGFPAAFAKELDIIAVGAMKSNGARASYSQGDIDEVTVLAMGEVECARTDSTWETRHTFGTSFAAPRVAGMIATWLSSEKYRERLQVKGKVAANVKNLLKELAYVKMPASEVDGGFPPNFYKLAVYNSHRI
ncbi:subtilase [Colletotrichum navitas]|uniref:Subtilase n=1 Tax=Colletotrichum navitas TaxID=681940 RepID=A0AAD8PSE8_9PEZI|nr:subtilase [Colletotrichum navitas]KAK1579387.1 subtilase [Colletotrichum navitas]